MAKTGASITWVPNLAAIEVAGKTYGAVGTALAAEDLLRHAQDIAPVDTGAYKASLRAEQQSDGSWIVLSDSPYGHYIEFGTSDTETFAVLRRASELADP